MGMLYGAQVQTMMPKLHSTNFEGMELIRPLYLIREMTLSHGETITTYISYSVRASLQTLAQPVTMKKTDQSVWK